MSRLNTRLEQLRSSSPKESLRLVYRKAIYRKVVMNRLGAVAGSHVPPKRDVAYRTELLGPDRYDVTVDSNPYVVERDVDHFRRQRSTCIAVYDGGRVAASSWMTSGSVYLHELQRYVDVPHDQHFSCRSYVDPDYRGQSLLTHMIFTYAQSIPNDQLVWGLVYGWNVASLRSLEALGWDHLGEEWSTYVLGMQRPGSSAVANVEQREPA